MVDVFSRVFHAVAAVVIVVGWLHFLLFVGVGYRVAAGPDRTSTTHTQTDTNSYTENSVAASHKRPTPNHIRTFSFMNFRYDGDAHAMLTH